MMRTTALLVAMVAFCGNTVPAQEAKTAPGEVKIRWFGQSFFQIETSTGTKIAIDPHLMVQYGRSAVTADIILCSHEHNDHAQVDAIENYEKAKVFKGTLTKGKTQSWVKIDKDAAPGIHIRTVGTYHDEEDGLKRGKNSIWIVEVDGLKIAHLGDLGHELSEAQVREVGPIDILMIPVGGIYTLNGEKARKVAADLKPRMYVIPMHCATKVFDDLLDPKEFLNGYKSYDDRSEKTNLLSIDPKAKIESLKVVLLGFKAP